MAWDDPAQVTVYPKGSQFGKAVPQTDLNSPGLTCGRSAFDSAAKTETADVLAGSEVGFRVSWSGGPRGTFVHPGPVQIYLSRAPEDNLAEYAGNGAWFKVAYGGPVSNTEWSTGVGFYVSVCITVTNQRATTRLLFRTPSGFSETTRKRDVSVRNLQQDEGWLTADHSVQLLYTREDAAWEVPSPH